LAKTFPHGSHNCSHITRKRGIYHYRRRLPGVRSGEVCISLRTRQYREAEHRASLLDDAFDDALWRARENMTDPGDLGPILRAYLQEFLADDLQRRIGRASGSPVYGYWWEPGDPGTATDADLQAIRQARDSLKRDLAENSPKEMEEYAEQLIREHGLPEQLLGPLTYGLLEAAIRGWETVEKRTLGTEPLVFAQDQPSPNPPVSGGSSDSPPATPSGPMASTLSGAFGKWGRESAGWTAGVESQARVSLALFVEVCGDRPVDVYTRGDGDTFRNTLRKLPTVYRKSANDRDKPLVEIIAEADKAKAPRISEKTLKRHFWAVSRFFAFLQETGRLPKTADRRGPGNSDRGLSSVCS
jgi:hypothetical protein